MKEKFYITTAIAYTSRKPHVGNTYEVVLTDAIARYKKLQGFDVFFLTGTDEHGQKIEEYADAAGVTPKAYVDDIASQIRAIVDGLNCKYDHFIRTTDEQHEKVVQKIFKKFYEQGDIYKSEYEGLYCVPCETFYTESQLKDGRCPDCGSEVKTTKEEAYFFKMSNYQQRLTQYITEHPDFIFPESRKNEMLGNFILPGVQDLCVSRTSFKWGIPVDFDPNHVVYVWLDALSNYITALGYDPDGSAPLFEKYWPADVHIIGKDILRFHTIYWPCFLMALDLPLPKRIFGHPWFLAGEDKMSKSKNNVMYADDLITLFGVDAVRYYLLSEMPYAQDGTVTYDGLIGRFNADLANTLGNLVNRTVAMNQKYFGGILQPAGEPDALDQDLIDTCFASVKGFCGKMDGFKVAQAIEELIALARRCNKYIDETMPWVLAKDPSSQQRLGAVLYRLLEAIRFLAVLCAPLMPQTSEDIFSQLGCAKCDFSTLDRFGLLQVGEKTREARVLFARIDEKKKADEITALIEKQNTSVKTPPKKQEQAAPAPGIITIEDFAKVSLVVAKITACEAVAKSDKLLRLTLDDGGEGRQVVSGIAKCYTPEALIGKKVAVVANLKPAKLRGVESQGMILAADAAPDQIQVLFVDDSVPCGAKIR